MRKIIVNSKKFQYETTVLKTNVSKHMLKNIQSKLKSKVNVDTMMFIEEIIDAGYFVSKCGSFVSDFFDHTQTWLQDKYPNVKEMYSI